MNRREPLVLTAPVAPRVLRRPLEQTSTMSEGVREAFSRALAGDFRPMEALELRFLNLLVRIGELAVTEPDGRAHWWFNPDAPRFASIDAERVAPFVLAIHRSFGRAGAPALEWALMELCRQCRGKLRRLPCRICGGEWYVDGEPDEMVYTTLEGVVLETA